MIEKCAASQPPPRGEGEEDQADNTGNTGNAGNAGSKVGKAGKAAVDEEDELPVQLGVHVGDIAYNLDITPRGTTTSAVSPRWHQGMGVTSMCQTVDDMCVRVLSIKTEWCVNVCVVCVVQRLYLKGFHFTLFFHTPV
jgi:hypothetical protein